MPETAIEAVSVKLEPCPFCGSTAIHQNHSARPGEYWFANSFVRCPTCRATGPTGSQDEAIAAWNRRSALAPAPSYERMREALRRLIAAYETTVEKGHERITELGGDCDPVERMLRDDPYLNAARVALANTEEKRG